MFAISTCDYHDLKKIFAMVNAFRGCSLECFFLNLCEHWPIIFKTMQDRLSMIYLASPSVIYMLCITGHLICWKWLVCLLLAFWSFKLQNIFFCQCLMENFEKYFEKTFEKILNCKLPEMKWNYNSSTSFWLAKWINLLYSHLIKHVLKIISRFFFFLKYFASEQKVAVTKNIIHLS